METFGELKEALRFLSALRQDAALRAAFEALVERDSHDALIRAFAADQGFVFDPRLLSRAYDLDLRMRRAAYASRADGHSSPKDK